MKGGSVVAQINPTTLDKKLLEHEIKTLIDSTRMAHQLKPLHNDSILFVASNHHSKYMVQKGLGHFEVNNKTFETPQLRASYYGAPANYYVGENVAYTPYNAPVKVKNKLFQTYTTKEIARSLVFAWVNSKGHYKNIVNPDYQVTGLSIGIDTLNQRIYSCQKFAQVLYVYTFKENNSFFPYANSITLAQAQQIEETVTNQPVTYPYELKTDTTACEACKEEWEKFPGVSVAIKNNHFILRFENETFIKSVIQNKWDGFAIEIMPFEPFACGNPAYTDEASRRNAKKRTSGKLLAPVYRDELIKGFKQRKKRKNFKFINYIMSADSVSFLKRFGRYKLVNFESNYFEYKIGKVPKDVSGWWNHNLVYIHNKQICHVVYLTNYPGELVLELMDVPYYPPVPKDDYSFEIEYFSDTLTLHFSVGETTPKETSFAELINRYQLKNLTITDVSIQGFCSVEGDSLINKRLHQDRAQNLLTKLKPLTSKSTRYYKSSQVDWNHFYEKTQKDKKWRFLAMLPKDQLLGYLNNSKNEQPTDILNDERRVVVVIHSVKYFNKKTAFYYVKRDFDSSFYRKTGTQLHTINDEKLSKLYEKAYYLTTVDSLSRKDFLRLTFPSGDFSSSHILHHDIAFYRYHLLKDSASASQLSQLEGEVAKAFDKCGAAEHLSPQFHYLHACLLVKKIQQEGKKGMVNKELIEKTFDRLNTLLTSYQLDSVFYLNVAVANLNVIQTLIASVGPEKIIEYSDIVNSSLIQIVEFYRFSHQLTPERVVALSKLLCYFQNVPLAIDLCTEFLDHPEVLKIYLKLAYNHSSFLSNEYQIQYEQNYLNLLYESRTKMTDNEWCELFYGQYGIPFQIMDSEKIHTQFCVSCPNRVNELFEEMKR